MNAMEPTDLVVMNAVTAEVVFAPGGVETILEKIIASARAVPTDISTSAGRAAIKSIAYKVARSRTTLDDMGKTLAAEWKKKAGAIDAERRTIRERLEALQEEVRKPLTDWENAENDRIANHEGQIALIEQTAILADRESSADEIARRLVLLSEMPARDWQEFAQRASIAMAGAHASLREAHVAAVKREADQAELTRLRQEQAQREQREREERIAAEAGERARVAAETKARQEAEQAAAKAEKERQRVEKEKADAIARAEKAETEKRAAIARAESEKLAAVESAQRERERAAKEAELQRLQAIEDERRRVAHDKASAEAQTAKREADKKHRAAINSAASKALIAGGLCEDAAHIAVTLIAQKAVPNVIIQY